MNSTVGPHQKWGDYQWRKHYNTKRPHSASGYCPMEPKPIMH
ncbi:integrase core domain-containing protein [Shimia abyssi]